MLERSIQLTDQIREDKSYVNSEEVGNRARILLTQCYCKHKEYDEAIRMIEEVLVNAKNGLKSEEGYAFALVEKATILAAKEDFNGAIAVQD